MAFVGSKERPACQLLDVAGKLPVMVRKADPPPMKPPPTIR